MFFIGVFGIQNKEKEIKALDKLQCKNCSNDIGGKLIKSYNFFHFFFIPLFKWGQRYYAICNGCNNIYEVPKEKGNAIEKGEYMELTYWDLKNIEDEVLEYTGNRKCNYCGKSINPEYDYCPYCGAKLKE